MVVHSEPSELAVQLQYAGRRKRDASNDDTREEVARLEADEVERDVFDVAENPNVVRPYTGPDVEGTSM